MSKTSLTVSLARRAKQALYSLHYNQKTFGFQVLETQTDDETLFRSLKALSTLEGENALPQLPHQLQSYIEAGGVKCATNILQLAEDIASQLTLLQNGVNDLQACTIQIRQELEICNSHTKPYLETTEKLEAEERANQEKEKLIDEFLHRYQLLPEEAAMLENGEVSETFFKTLNRAHTIHSNCRDLLRTQHQRAGLELMDTMARYQEAALKRLVHWIQTKCQEVVDVEAAEMDTFMRQALQALSARPVLYRYCAEEVAEARHDALFERFIASLSHGTRPIEMQSDDPKRYLNDMLAWVHQSLASEMELLEALFKDVPKTHEPPVKDLPSMTDLLNKIFHSIDRPLKVRIEQVLMMPPAPVLCFELSCLLEFYMNVIRDIAGKQFSLAESLQSCLDMAVRTLHEQIHSRGTRLSRHSIVVPRDLSPPAELMETVQFLLQLMNANDSALKSLEIQEGLRLPALGTALLQPLLETCLRSASDLDSGNLGPSHSMQNVPPAKMFMINCIEAIVLSLDGRAVIEQTCNQLKVQLQVVSLPKEIFDIVFRQT